MPGTPDPILGSRLANWIGALAVATVLVLGPLLVRDRSTPARVAAASGITAAVVGLSIWALPRLATGAFATYSWGDPVVAAGVYAAGTAVLALQVAGPVYGSLEYDLVAPLAAGVGATTLVTFLFLGLRGETEPFSLYVIASPLVLGAILLVALLELGTRRLWPLDHRPG